MDLQLALREGLAGDLLFARTNAVGDARREHLASFREALLASPSASAFYIGYDNRDFFLLLRLANRSDRDLMGAPPGAAYLLQSIDQGAGRFVFLDRAVDPKTGRMK